MLASLVSDIFHILVWRILSVYSFGNGARMSDDRTKRFEVQDGEIEMVKQSHSGLILTPDAINRGRARVAAGDDPDVVAHDLATEEVELRGKLENAP